MVTGYKHIIFVFSLSVVLSACGPTPKQAVAYNRKLTYWQLQVKVAGDSLESALMSFDTLKIKVALDSAKIYVHRNLRALSERGKLKNDSLLYVAHRDYLRCMDSVLHEEYQTMYRLYCLPDEDFGLKGENEFVKVQTTKNQRIKKAFVKLSNAQQDFANRYNLILKKEEVNLVNLYN